MHCVQANSCWETSSDMLINTSISRISLLYVLIKILYNKHNNTNIETDNKLQTVFHYIKRIIDVNNHTNIDFLLLIA